MEEFKKTGVHPEIEAARQRAANEVEPLPEASLGRPYVFLDVQINKTPLGEWRCSSGARAGVGGRAGGRANGVWAGTQFDYLTECAPSIVCSLLVQCSLSR